MLSLQREKNRIFTKLLALFIAQAFFFTGIAYPVSPVSGSRGDINDHLRPQLLFSRDEKNSGEERMKGALSRKEDIKLGQDPIEAIGKFFIEKVVYDTMEYKVKVTLIDIENPEETPEVVSIDAKEEPTGLINATLRELQRMAKGNPIVNDIVQWYLREFRQGGGRTLTLRDNKKGLLGFGSEDIIAVSHHLIGDPMALLHEIGHSYLIAHPEARGVVEDELKEKGIDWVDSKDRLIVDATGRSLRDHYLLMAFQKKISRRGNKRLTAAIKSIKEGKKKKRRSAPLVFVRYKKEKKKAIRKYIRRLEFMGLLSAVSVTAFLVYYDADTSRREAEEALNRGFSESNAVSTYVDNKKQHQSEVDYGIGLQANRQNLLTPVESERVEEFLGKGKRYDVIRFIAKKFRLESDLLAGALYEEEKGKSASRRAFDLFTTGMGGVDRVHIFNRGFLDSLFKNRDYLSSVIGPSSSKDLGRFQEFIDFYKGSYNNPKVEFTGLMAHVESKGFNDLDEIEAINIFHVGFLIREIAGKIEDANRGVTAIPNMYTLRGHSNTWLLKEYQEIPAGETRYGDLVNRYGRPFGGRGYYHPLIRYFAVFQRYSGGKINFTRSRAKVNAYQMFLRSGVFKRTDDSLHASWAHVKGLSPNNFHETNMIMPDRKEVDRSLVDSLREQGKDIMPGQVVEIDGYEFQVIEVKGQKVLVSTDIIGKTDGEALSLLSKALSETGFKGTEDGLPLIVSSLSKSPRLFEDCYKNGFIGINQAFLTLYDSVSDSQIEYMKILLQVGFEHELRHEKGETDESKLIGIDAERIIGLCEVNSVYIEDFTEFFRDNEVIDKDFTKVLRKLAQIRTRVEENLKSLREEWAREPDSFISGRDQRGVDWILGYMEKDPECFIGYGDMKKISAINKAFVPEIVDKLIPLVVSATNHILAKYEYRGGAIRKGGDEVDIVLGSHLSQKEVNNIRLELQYTLAEFIPYYGFVKLRGVNDENVNSINKILETDDITGVYKDDDGFFLVFDRRKAGNDLESSCRFAIADINKRGPFTIEQGGDPLEIPSPRMNFGITRASDISENTLVNYAISIKYAEYLHNIAEKKAGLNGATPSIVREFDNFDENMEYTTIPKLTPEEREELADKYANDLGIPLGIDYIDEYYPVIKREYLHTIIENMPSSRPGSIFVIRGPPDNFYIVMKSVDGSVFLIKEEPLYRPVEEGFRRRVEKALQEAKENGGATESILREKWPEDQPGWYGFKIINEYFGQQPDHAKGNQIILEAIKKLTQGNFEELSNLSESELEEALIDEEHRPINGQLGGSAEVKFIVGMLKIGEDDLGRLGETIKIVDYLTKMAQPLGEYENIFSRYDPDKKDEFWAKVALFRSKERKKFQTILEHAYSEPILNQADLMGYTLLDDSIDTLTREDKKKFYLELAEDISNYVESARYLKDNDPAFCLKRSSFIVRMLHKEFGIEADIVNDQDDHYWIETKDGFLIDAYPLGYGNHLLIKRAQDFGNKDIIIIDLANMGRKEQSTKDGFYKGRVNSGAVMEALKSDDYIMRTKSTLPSRKIREMQTAL